jgi:hypothetical protein
VNTSCFSVCLPAIDTSVGVSANDLHHDINVCYVLANTHDGSLCHMRTQNNREFIMFMLQSRDTNRRSANCKYHYHYHHYSLGPLVKKVNVKGKVVPAPNNHAMKAYWGSRGIAPRILDLGTRWRWGVSLSLYRSSKFPFLPRSPKFRNTLGIQYQSVSKSFRTESTKK